MRLVWLASFPKSGNTWLRLLLANLKREQPIGINELQSAGIASSRARFDEAMLFPAGLLTHDECDAMRPLLYADMIARADPDGAEKVSFVKTHDAWTRVADTDLLGAADGAILIVRDPRAVAASLANHNDREIDQTITIMADVDHTLCGRDDRLHNQLRQQLLGWSGFNASWLERCSIPLHVISYEAMIRDTAGTLATVLAFAGVDTTDDEIARAVRFADFSSLRAQETAAGGFREAPRRLRERRFFRNGTADGWRDELSPEQVARIEADHGRMMARLGYVVETTGGELR